MRLVFFTHYFPPEGNAPASRTYEHCLRWVRAGVHVTVITCQPNVPNGVVYDGYRNHLLPQREQVDGIDVLRVWTYVAPNAGSGKRIANYLSYMFSALFAFLFFCRRPNVIIATSPQFFCGWAGVLASWLKWCPLIVEIRDIWPESIVTVGAMRKGLVTRALEVMEKWLYRSANFVVTVGHGYRENIERKANVGNRIAVITNGVDVARFSPAERCDEFRASYSVENQFVCSYVGTIGMAHGLEVAIKAAKLLMESGRLDISFLLVGDGARRRELEQLAEQDGVSELVRFAGRLDKDMMPKVLANSDCLLVHLKASDLFETVIPSKIFEAMAMQRPLIMGVRGESAEIVRKSGAGVFMEPDNAEQLVAAIVQLKDDREHYEALCQSGRDFVAAEYSRERLAGEYLDIIKQVARPSR